MQLENEHRYLVHVGTYKNEKSAIIRQQDVSKAGFKTEILDTQDDSMANLNAALLLIAEQLKDIKEMLGTLKPMQAPVTESKKEAVDTVEFGKAVRAARISRGLSQSEVGILCGVSNKTISRIEVGDYPVSAEIIEKVKNVLKMK
jgi:DNA-binding XRE family transcriptional regulator